MSIERKIYPGYAFTENAYEKRDINEEIYEELCEKYKVTRSTSHWSKEEGKMIPINERDFDVVVECVQHRYGSNVYSIVKNGPGLNDDELALICDDGNICFNYTKEASHIVIFTD